MPGDHTGATGTVTFAPGDTSEPITAQTTEDETSKASETFAVNLSNVTDNATSADAIGVGTVIDDAPGNLGPTADAGADQTVDSGRR